jgi:hypothetical protein
MISKKCSRCGKFIWGDCENELNFKMIVHNNTKKCKETYNLNKISRIWREK